MNKQSYLEIAAVLLMVAVFYFFMVEEGEYKPRPPTPPESLYTPKNVMWRR